MKKEKKQTWTVSVLTKNLSPASFSLNSMRLTSKHAQLKRQVIFTWKITKLVLCPNVNPKSKQHLSSYPKNNKIRVRIHAPRSSCCKESRSICCWIKEEHTHVNIK
jgi:hypothetical protein